MESAAVKLAQTENHSSKSVEQLRIIATILMLLCHTYVKHCSQTNLQNESHHSNPSVKESVKSTFSVWC